MIIWRGLGFLVFVITLAALIFMEVLTGRLFHDPSYYAAHGWPKLVGFLIAAVAVWLLGNSLNRRPGRVVIDKATGRQVVLKPTHSLFFIRVDYWAAILVVLGIVFLFVSG